MLRSSLEVIQQDNRSCRSCSLRKEDNPVAGLGNKNAKMVLVGEYPSKDEALVGRPFEERSGFLLKKILSDANIDCDNIYMTYTVRCNGSSREVIDHVNDCKKWLWQELQLIDPKIIVTLGKIPTKLLLKPKANFTLESMIGKLYQVDYLPNTSISPWYGATTLLQRGNWSTIQTINFFKNLKRVYNV